MQTAQPERLDAWWPDHGEDLSAVMFAQSLLQHFGNELAITPATPAAETINPIFSSHPLNASHRELSTEECERLWNALISEKPDTIMLNDLKAEALRQVRIYIRKGLDTLRRAQATQSIKRSRSGSLGPEEDADSGVKKRRINDQPEEGFKAQTEDFASKEADPAAEAGEAAAGTGSAGSETGAAGPAASDTAPGAGPDAGPDAAPETETGPEAEPAQKQGSTPAAAQEGDPDKDAEPEQSADVNESDSSEQAEPEVPDSEAAEASLPANVQQEDEAHADADAESRNDSEDSRQSSAAPEEPQEDASAAALDTKKSPEVPKLDLPPDSQNDAAEQPKIRRRSRASRASRSARTTPQSSRAASAEPSASASPGSDAALNVKDDEPKDQSQQRTRKRRGSTASVSDNTSDGTLSSLLSTLRSSSVLEPFQKPFSKRNRVVLSPTDLSLIQSQVENQELETLDEVEQELAKMLANAVMGARMDITEPASFIWKEVAEFRKHAVDGPAESTQGPPSNKRRRKD